jgi:hypothetical protein
MRPVGLVSVMLAAAITVGGCASTEPVAQTSVAVLDTRVSRERPSTWMGLPLKSGQVVVSEAPGAYSFLFSLCPERFFLFTHAAILVMEDGEPWVYDMSGRYKPGFGDSPADGIVGACRRQRLLDYAAPNLYVEILDPPPGVDPDRVAAWVQEQYAANVDFDPYWRFDDHDALFCTEMVQMALQAGGYPPIRLEPVRKNRSLVALLDWFGVDYAKGLPAGRYHDPERYVGAMGQVASRTEAYAYFAAKAEIHRRFADDQVLGNVFVMRGRADVGLRPEIDLFLARARALFQATRMAPTQVEIEAKVRALADEMFGPVA